jgi:hypothetical protein
MVAALYAMPTLQERRSPKQFVHQTCKHIRTDIADVMGGGRDAQVHSVLVFLVAFIRCDLSYQVSCNRAVRSRFLDMLLHRDRKSVSAKPTMEAAIS